MSYRFRKIPAGILELIQGLKTWQFWLGRGEILNDHANLLLCLVLVITIITGNILEVKASVFDRLNAQAVYVRWSVYYLLVGIIWYWGVFGERQFIYFQF